MRISNRKADRLPGSKAPNPRTLAIHAARAAAEKQAHDILVLSVRELTAVADFFVIASGTTDRQVRAIGESVEEDLRAAGAKPLRREGERDMAWLLLDYGDIIVHIFRDQERAYYELERLWKDAPTVAWEPRKRATSTARATAESV